MRLAGTFAAILLLTVWGCSGMKQAEVTSAEKSLQAEFETPLDKASRKDPAIRDSSLPTLFIVGDSTVKNHGEGWGWGDLVAPYFDLSRLNVVNWAMGGRSSRSFIEEGRWAKVLAQMKKGDFVLLQFGHNDQSPLTTYRGTILGDGPKTEDVIFDRTGQMVTIHTFGWYMRQYVADTRGKGATPIFVTPVPRAHWTKEGALKPVMRPHAELMLKIAAEEGIACIDENKAVARQYVQMGQERVQKEYFSLGGGTHPNLEGAKVNAGYVVEGIKGLGKDYRLADYLKNQ
jgi:rhamnogalacturonan acetylesterase